MQTQKFSFAAIAIALLLSTNITAQSAATGTINGHDYVDLGLSVKWATCNIGASSPSDYGDYFAWGEAETKSEYTKENSATYGKDNFTFHDAAAEKWGGSWRMPTHEELKELWLTCDVRYDSIDNRPILKLTSKINDNYIYLPLAGKYEDTNFNSGNAYYWSSSNFDGENEKAISVQIDNGSLRMSSMAIELYYGFSIRPVSDGTPVSATTEITTINGYQYVDLGLSVKWGVCNVGSAIPTYAGDYFAFGEIERNSIGDYSKEGGHVIYDIAGDKRYDAATAVWGEAWRMPTYVEIEELTKGCTSEYVTQDGQNGIMFTSKTTGKSIFLPLDKGSSDVYHYWSSSMCDEYGNLRDYSYMLSCDVDTFPCLNPETGKIEHMITSGYNFESFRWHGLPIRPVTESNSKKLGHDYVDLGLSVKWATCNIGASKPSDYGDRYAWGEVKTKSEYTEANYTGTEAGQTRKVIIDKSHDAATVERGAPWRMPSIAEFRELMENCDLNVEKMHNISCAGVTLISRKNGKSIFLPAGGYYEGHSNHELNEMIRTDDDIQILSSCRYWSSSNDDSNDEQAWHMFFIETASYDVISRYLGMLIRPVVME